MKRIIIFSLLVFMGLGAYAQPAAESTLKKFSIGYDLYTSIYLDMPTGVKTRTINQGANVFLMYNHLMGDDGFSFAGGVGITSENLYLKDAYIPNVKADSISFEPYPLGVDAKRYKLNVTYIDIPIEVRYVTENKMRFTLGMKFGFLIDSKDKYLGDAFDENGTLGYGTHEKHKTVNQLESTRYGVQARVGWKWVHIYGYYSLNKIFTANNGPQMYPISVGVTFMPF
ncbi:MAG: outer membrane beta-barrel protein [Bacteroidales bacterium]|nr:outer membrane beta-barrel protein [Bacteroidales bacterium]